LLQRIFEVDPLRCPRCGGDMRIVAFVLDHQVVHAILEHLRKSRPDPRALLRTRFSSINRRDRQGTG
jgi:hypothetical protein